MCLEIFTLQSNSMIILAKPRMHIIYKEQFRDQQLTIAKDLKCWSKILLINELIKLINSLINFKGICHFLGIFILKTNKGR